jgi:ActR/RegA family two-component response regulator
VPAAARQILICDDDHRAVAELAGALARQGFRPESYRTAEACVSAAERSAPPFVVLEPNLPSRSWYRFLHEMVTCLRGLSRIVVVTAYPSAAMAGEVERLGIRHYLAKPVAPVEILSALQGEAALSFAPAGQGSRLLAAVEWEHINQVVCACRGNMSVAARELGLPRQTLYAKLRKLPAPGGRARVGAWLACDERGGGQGMAWTARRR